MDLKLSSTSYNQNFITYRELLTLAVINNELVACVYMWPDLRKGTFFTHKI